MPGREITSFIVSFARFFPQKLYFLIKTDLILVYKYLQAWEVEAGKYHKLHPHTNIYHENYYYIYNFINLKGKIMSLIPFIYQR